MTQFDLKDIEDVDDIITLVDTFYVKASSDNLLEAFFHHLADPHCHKEILYKYWEETLLKEETSATGSFPKHIEWMFTTQHFVRWLTLFLQTIDNLYSGPNAEKAKVIAIRKSQEFQRSRVIFRLG